MEKEGKSFIKGRSGDTPYGRSVQEVLEQVMDVHGPKGRKLSGKHQRVTPKVISDVVFGDIFTGHGKKKVNSIKLLQLLEILCDFFGDPSDEDSSDDPTGIVALFPAEEVDRYPILAKLICMALSIKIVPVLDTTSVWMEQMGCTSKATKAVVEMIVQDHFIMAPDVVVGLKDLPLTAPRFTANFLVAVSSHYGILKSNLTFTPPPLTLLEIITQWVAENHLLYYCLSSEVSDPSPEETLAASFSNQSSVSCIPTATLFKWCILAPLYSTSKDKDITCKDTGSISKPKDLHSAIYKSYNEKYKDTYTSRFEDIYTSKIKDPYTPKDKDLYPYPSKYDDGYPSMYREEYEDSCRPRYTDTYASRYKKLEERYFKLYGPIKVQEASTSEGSDALSGSTDSASSVKVTVSKEKDTGFKDHEIVFKDKDDAPKDKDTAPKEKDIKEVTEDTYARLHAALLDSVLQCYYRKNSPHYILPASRQCIASSRDMVLLIKAIAQYKDALNIDPSEDEALILSMDRISQLINILLLTDCLAGCKDDMFNVLCKLPEHQLLEMVLEVNLK